ncbi:MAG: hypothetical protein M3Y33_12910 [Actinomycetota bacterium]|nr:hypothetical protein [Actinomycetota bacterium]
MASGITTVSISGGTTQAAGYSYNTRGEQSQISDGGQDWSAGYNLLGQVTSTTDPDAGTTTRGYDGNGNLTSTTDANGKTVSYAYDALNRKTGEYDGPAGSSPPIATRAYDNSNDAVSGMTDPVGQLTTQTSYDGNGNAYTLQQKGFNAFGESAGQTWTIPPAQGALAGTYTMSQTYTSIAGLPLKTIYPASPGGALPAETVTDGYTAGFNLPNTVGSSVAGSYDQGTSYNALSRVAQTEVGTSTAGAFISDTYDPHTANLTGSEAQGSGSSPATFDDTTYAYDPAGNITAQADERNGTQSETQCYAYDTLGQLTQAWTATDDCKATPSSGGGPAVGDGIPGSAYWTSWAFSALGQRTSQTQHPVSGGQDTVTSYAYGTSQPGTLASASTTGPSGNTSASYGYDADGNTTSRDVPGGSQALSWNDNGTLAADTSPAGSASYVYDAGGSVLLQSDSATGQVTLYVFGEQLALNTSAGTVTGTRLIPLPGGAQAVRTGTGTGYAYEIASQQGTGVMTLTAAAASPSWRQFTPTAPPAAPHPPPGPTPTGSSASQPTPLPA